MSCLAAVLPRASHILACALTFLFSFTFFAAPATAQSTGVTFIVNSTDDSADANTSDNTCADSSGKCTLRAAIEQANAMPGRDTVNFSIGSGAVTISSGAGITDALVIDGTSQPGFVDAPIVQLTGGLAITVNDITIRGLVLSGITIRPRGAVNDGSFCPGCFSGLTGIVIEGNYIGVNRNGNELAGSGLIDVRGSSVRIGGITTGARNVIAGGISVTCDRESPAFGNRIAGGSATIQGNYIGTDATGKTALANAGIQVSGGMVLGSQGCFGSALVGGDTVNARNVITGDIIDAMDNRGATNLIIQNNFIGTNAEGSEKIGTGMINGGTTVLVIDNLVAGKIRAIGFSTEINKINIAGNYVGTDASGTKAITVTQNELRNTGNGIEAVGGSSVALVGVIANQDGTFTDRGNIVAFFDGNGITAGSRIRVSNNTVFSNGGNGITLNPSSGQAIETTNNTIHSNGGNGVNVNESDLSNTFTILSNSIFGNVGVGIKRATTISPLPPVLSSVSTSQGNTTITGGALDGSTVQFFVNNECDLSGSGEGQRLIGTATVSGNPFSFTFPGAISPDQFITATSTILSPSPRGTSEFSNCRPLGSAGRLQFSSPTYAFNEGVGTANVIVERVGGTSGAATIQYTFNFGNGTATHGVDYSPPFSGTLTYADGETSKSISVPITDDVRDEEDETGSFTLSNPQRGATLGTNTTAVISIIDNDAPPTFSISDVSVNEPLSGTATATFTVTLSETSQKNITVNYGTSNNTAMLGSDYEPTGGTLTFAPSANATGARTQTIVVSVLNDRINESPETFIVFLSGAVNATFAKAQGQGTIINTPPKGRSSPRFRRR